ncbi:MAG: N-6 DNA methylase [Verrucomicrobia bacterium]|nr:N-6 DNA methylase [Verrucomicrobiota bacterium]
MASTISESSGSSRTFSSAKADFDQKHLTAATTKCIVPVNGKARDAASIRDKQGKPSEEYYKWQFIYALINSGLFARDFVGVEVQFPKGNSALLRLDGAIFDSGDWLGHYNAYWKDRRSTDLEWLNDHLLAVIEFKKNDKEIEKVFTSQVKPAMREKEPADAYVLGVYYGADRLYLFQRRDGKYLRYDESKNQKSDESKVSDLSLHLPDPYGYLPDFEDLRKRVNRPASFDRSKRTIYDLDIITTIASVQIKTALSDVLRALDKVNLVDQRGYGIFLQAFALKVYDEKRNEKHPHRFLDFYVTDTEAGFHALSDAPIKGFIKRIHALRDEAAGEYQKIFATNVIEWRDPNDVRAVVAIAQAFQDYSFVLSSKSDLYQLVFYNFANSFKRDEAAQFLTPLPVIDFIVRLVNPRDGETVFDPCCGIADFLSLSFVHALSKPVGWKLDDANIYGVDLDKNMVSLATLNMLLNGDGEAKLFAKSDKGSILTKIADSSPPALVDLIPSEHARGQWEIWPDKTKLKKFDVVLTNPPFGEDRAYRVKTDADRQVIEMYETWHLTRQKADEKDAFGATHEREKKKPAAKGSDALDLGIVFLENAYRCVKEDGRFGIVLSNSIASINRWKRVRKWLMQRMRIVALFDLPANVFAETGVNTSIIIAYRPKPAALKRLNESGYSIFVRDIQRVGYEKRTSKRNVFFNPIYQIDETTFDIRVNEHGEPVLDEEFTETLAEFRLWALGQEKTLQDLFLKES